MARCGVWLCPFPPVERLEHFNPLCGGAGFLNVCAGHLAEHKREHLLEADHG